MTIPSAVRFPSVSPTDGGRGGAARGDESYRAMTSRATVLVMTFFVMPLVAAPRAGPAPTFAAPTLERFVIVPAESQVIYRVVETLFNENNRFNIAVGTTQVVRGDLPGPPESAEEPGRDDDCGHQPVQVRQRPP